MTNFFLFKLRLLFSKSEFRNKVRFIRKSAKANTTLIFCHYILIIICINHLNETRTAQLLEKRGTERDDAMDFKLHMSESPKVIFVNLTFGSLKHIKGGQSINQVNEYLSIIAMAINFICICKLKKKKTFFLIFVVVFKLANKTSFQKEKCFSKLANCLNCHFFSLVSIDISNDVSDNFKEEMFSFFAISKIYFKNNFKFFNIILILSGDISLHPGPKIVCCNDCDICKCFSGRGIHLIHLNVNSILPKIDEVRILAKCSSASFIGISETKLDQSVSDAEVSIEGYNLIRQDRNRHGGGVACYIKSNLSYDIKNYFDEDIENIFFDILLPKTKAFTVGVFYRPPPNQNNFLDIISEDFDKLKSEDKEVYILGDLNINVLLNGKSILEKKNISSFSDSHTTSSISKQYIQFCSYYSLSQLIDSPTRITCNTTSLLDHILTNTPDKIQQSGVIDIGISDHQLIFCTRKTQKRKLGKHNYVKFRSFKNYSLEDYENSLRAVNFSNYEDFECLDTAYSDFINKLMEVVNTSAPVLERRIKNHTEEWFDGDIAELITIRNKLSKKFKKTRLNIDEQLYKEAKYKVDNLIKNKKKQFFEEKLKENVGKPKELWKTLKSLGLPNKKSSSSNVCLHNEKGELTFEPKLNANIFKTFFANLASDLVAKLPSPPNIFSDHSTLDFYKDFNISGNNFNFEKISEKHVFDQLVTMNPNKAAGIDNLSGRFLKDGANILALPISQICNLSIMLSIFPSKCKIAKLKPLYKKGSRTNPKNYRPISLLPLISKVIEKIIHQQVQEYLDQNKVLFNFQSGFRSNHSTDTCLSYLHDKILTGFDKGLMTGMIAIDLQKAFDTIDHNILIRKMKIIGFSNNTIKWFQSYLSDRIFYVSVDNYLSDPGKINCGVPQGSILGPLLFLIYINDMSQSVNSELYLYADDSCILFQNKNIKSINDQLNLDFSSICDWFVDNKLSIHFGEDKTKCILFTSKGKKQPGALDISYKDREIKQHCNFTYLGGILNDKMSGEGMALNAIHKINSRLKFLYRKDMFLTYDLRRLLCNALIQPNFDYVCSSWYPTISQKLKEKLQASQNKCIKFCLKLPQRTSLNSSHFIKINWLPVKDRVLQCTVAHVFKYFNKKCPIYFTELFQTVNLSNISTRRSYLKLYQPSRKTNYGKNTLSYLGPKIWNALPDLIKKCKSLNNFKHKLKEYYFEHLKSKEKNIFAFY